MSFFFKKSVNYLICHEKYKIDKTTCFIYEIEILFKIIPNVKVANYLAQTNWEIDFKIKISYNKNVTKCKRLFSHQINGHDAAKYFTKKVRTCININLFFYNHIT